MIDAQDGALTIGTRTNRVRLLLASSLRPNNCVTFTFAQAVQLTFGADTQDYITITTSYPLRSRTYTITSGSAPPQMASCESCSLSHRVS